MSSHAHGFATVKDYYLVCMTDSAYSLRNDYLCCIPKLLVKTLSELCVCLVIKG